MELRWLGVAGIMIVGLLSIVFYYPEFFGVKPSEPDKTPTPLEKYWPTKGWTTAEPERVGIDKEMLAKSVKEIRDRNLPVDSLMVVKDGYIVLDEYFGNFKKSDKHSIYSCTKSIVSTLVGIAIDRGEIESINVKVLDVYSDRVISNLSDWKKSLTLKHLLTMSAGLDAKDEYRHNWIGLNALITNPDPIQYALDLPIIWEPGTQFEYTNAVAHLISGILTEHTGMSAFNYAKQYLFKPLNITDVDWSQDPQGMSWGYARIMMKPHDMAKIGYLFLKKGMWEGRRIVSETWVEDATRKHIDASLVPGYGYEWWVDPRGYYEALGYMGQFIYVVPSKNLVVVFTGATPENFNNPKQLLDSYIIPSVK